MYISERTLRDIVTENFNSASVLEKYGLDFCCKGGVSLKDACETKTIDWEKVAEELSEVTYEESSQRYFRWELPFLIDYIINNHHSYVKSQLPLIWLHLEKVVRAHGERHPEVIEVERIFQFHSLSLQNHMMKEEKILFPFIKQLVQTQATGGTVSNGHFGNILEPINAMLAEHEAVGDALAQIRELLDDYSPPADACTTMRLLYQELDGFEQDLHKHVFLENSILFPKASRLEKEVLESSVI